VSEHVDLLHSPEIIELGPQCVERYFCDSAYPALTQLGLPAVGLSNLAGHYRVERCLRMHLLEITVAGHGQASAGPWQGVLRPDSVLAVPAGTPYRLATDRGRPWSTVWALLDPRKWREFPATTALAEEVSAAPLVALLQLLDRERHADDHASALLRRSLTESLSLLFQRVVHLAGAPLDRHRAVLQALFDEVSRRPAEDWNAARLAARAGCSRSQLHRRCVAFFGRSPAAQVGWIRMQQAEYWLSTTRLPLKAVAEHLGFQNPFHFSTAFKRWSGLSPAHYRAQRAAEPSPRSGRARTAR
jgi:AraC-like DNA-binding protein